MDIIPYIFVSLGALIVGYVLRVLVNEGGFEKTRKKADKLIEDARKNADKNKKQSILETKQEIFNIKAEADKDLKERKLQVQKLEDKISKREDSLDQRADSIDKRENNLNQKEMRLDDLKEKLENEKVKVEDIYKQQQDKLIEISGISKEDASKEIMRLVEEEMAMEIAAYIKDEEEKAKLIADNKAKNILALAIHKYSGDVTGERTVSVINLPNDEMKGRIIGREGRNIRTIEALTGVDLIIDDTPEAIVVSGFDPIRREVAKAAVSKLVNDGRIHPARIEEVVEKTRQDIETLVREKGEDAVFKLGIGKVHPDLIKLIGRLHFRTSYGQNGLDHSMECAYLAGKLAAELGEDEVLAKRAGLLHDIGKAVDHEIEGSHVEIGVDFAKRYKEPAEVIDGIASHHGDKKPESVIAVLVGAADALSAARPGARNESLQNYINRLEELEELSNAIEGVDQSFALQAGRELRVIVKPDKIDDLSTHKVAREIKEKIEENLKYPGTIKVTVIRETRAFDEAK